jgi:sulfur transfer complex TusBCD TusB component (DsrH family)
VAVNIDDLEDSLPQFRLDIINRLAEISAEISALQTAVLEALVSKERLKSIRNKSRKLLHKFGDTHALNISPPHQLR